MNGSRTLSCVTPVIMADGKKITTIEGFSDGDSLHPIQQAFLDEGAIQCGYCSAGMILSAAALLKNNPKPTEAQIKEGMNGNICRCNGYTKIINAVRRAAVQMTEVKIP
jgi:aerobic-type carbon monoxide dehydrogenase small subunit (CoxS/CutS family)